MGAVRNALCNEEASVGATGGGNNVESVGQTGGEDEFHIPKRSKTSEAWNENKEFDEMVIIMQYACIVTKIISRKI